jgi:hypothetical protein
MGGLIAAGLHKWLHRLTLPLNVLHAAGLSLFAVTGTEPGQRLAGRPAVVDPAAASRPARPAR